MDAVRRFHSSAACAGNFSREAECCRNDRARASREEGAFFGLLDLLHDGEHWRVIGTFRRFSRATLSGLPARFFLIAAAAVFRDVLLCPCVFSESQKRIDDRPVPTIGQTFRNFATVAEQSEVS